MVLCVMRYNYKKKSIEEPVYYFAMRQNVMVGINCIVLRSEKTMIKHRHGHVYCGVA